MPSPKYTSRATVFAFNDLHAVHLSLGDCLLAGFGKSPRSCACGLRDHDGVFQAEIAQHLWSTHRREVMQEHGSTPYPPFAAVLFDAAPLPESSDGWTDDDLGGYSIMCDELRRARSR